jgi:hypothetical protein
MQYKSTSARSAEFLKTPVGLRPPSVFKNSIPTSAQYYTINVYKIKKERDLT